MGHRGKFGHFSSPQSFSLSHSTRCPGAHPWSTSVHFPTPADHVGVGTCCPAMLRANGKWVPALLCCTCSPGWFTGLWRFLTANHKGQMAGNMSRIPSKRTCEMGGCYMRLAMEAVRLLGPERSWREHGMVLFCIVSLNSSSLKFLLAGIQSYEFSS